MANREMLGRGWGFPPQFARNRKALEMVSAEEDIRQSLTILFSTVPGERVMQPDYGCGLHAMVFEGIDEATLTEIRDVIDRAVLFFEPRIDLESVDVTVEDELAGHLEITVAYRIRGTNSRSNMVYPFYVLEGTHLWASR